MDESANKGLELSGRDAEFPKFRINFRQKYGGAVAMDKSDIKGPEGRELNGRMVVEGYDTSLPMEDVEEALTKHLASRGIKLIFASVPQVQDSDILCRFALLYINQECEAEALKLCGSDMGGRILRIMAYPFDENRLEHVFAVAECTSLAECICHYQRQRTFHVTGFDTSLSEDKIEQMLDGVLPGVGCFSSGNGSALLYLRGQDAFDKALKLSGGSVGGSKFTVTAVFPRIQEKAGVSRASMLAMAERARANKKMISTTY